MGSDQSFVDFVIDQIEPECAVTARKMFGEYGLYSHGKLFGLVCDNRLFVKPTTGGRAHIGEVTEAPPYPGAKPSFLIEDEIEDGGWLSDLVRITVAELPAPEVRKPRAKGGRKAKTGSAKKAKTGPATKGSATDGSAKTSSGTKGSARRVSKGPVG